MAAKWDRSFCDFLHVEQGQTFPYSQLVSRTAFPLSRSLALWGREALQP